MKLLLDTHVVLWVLLDDARLRARQRRLIENAETVFVSTLAHARRVAELPQHHRDPFDHILVAQALVEDLTLLTTDDQIGRYPMKVRW